MLIKKLLVREVLTFCQNFQVKVIGNQKKKNLYKLPKRELKTHLASTASSACGTIKHRRLIRKRLKSHLPFNHCHGLGIQSCFNQRHNLGSQLAATLFNSFTKSSTIPNKVTLSLNEAFDTGYALWRRHPCCTKTKDLISAAHSLCKYT